MAVTLRIEDAELVVRLDGWQRWAALKREVRSPLATVTSAAIARDAGKLTRGLRMPGTSVPGRIYAGTWRIKGAADFWIVSNPREVLVLTFAGQPYDRWLLTVDDPEGWVRRLSRRSGSGFA